MKTTEHHVPYAMTRYGFQYGSALVERIHGHDTGAVTIGIKSPKGEVQVYVTRTGKIRVLKDGVEMRVGEP